MIQSFYYNLYGQVIVMPDNNIHYKFFDGISRDTSVASGVFDILVMCNDEFIPPLNTRKTTVQKELSETTSFEQTPQSYFREVIDQQNIIAFDGEMVVAFMSFKYNFKDNVFSAVINGKVNNYISTICTHKNYRKLGIAQALYDYVENTLPIEFASKYVSTRTWSTNNSHINLLLRRDYVLVKKIPNDREFNSVKYDSVYFYRENK